MECGVTPAVQQAVRTALLERMRGRTPAEVARLAGLHVRTVQRALGLAGRPTWSTPTVQRIARVLRVDLDSVRPVSEQDGAGRSKVEQDGAPVSGWEQAALVLRVSRWTLRRARTRAQDQRAP